MIEDIMYTFDKNFLRLNNLIALYKDLSQGQGRKPTNLLDILRSTTVLAHATLEDYLRNLLSWKLPTETKEKINKIPLIGTSSSGQATKFFLGELVAHKGKTIDDILTLSIDEYLEKTSFNNTDDIVKALKDISLNITPEIQSTFPKLNEMINRRHNIVHRADRGNNSGRGHHKVKSLSVRQIESWKQAIDQLVIEINKNFIN